MSPFGANTYSYLRSHGAAACLARLAELGFSEFEVMVHPGHLWPADLSAGQRGELRRLLVHNGWTLTSLNMPNIDINVAAAAPGMRAYSLALLEDAIRLAGDLGAPGVVIGPGKANPLFPADASELIGHFLRGARPALPGRPRQRAPRCGSRTFRSRSCPAIGELMDALDRYGNDAVRIVYDVANAHYLGEELAAGLERSRPRLALVHLSDTGRQAFRHDPVGLGSVPFGQVPAALATVGYRARPTLEIISRDPDRDIVASAAALTRLGFAAAA